MVKTCFLLIAAAAWLGAMKTPPAHPPLASLSGRVAFSGAVPPATPADMSSEPYCVTQQRGQPARSRVRVGEQNGLADVVVHVKGVASAASKPAPSDPVVLDQKGCEYQPAVLALRVGQPLVVRNSDAVLHNVHAKPSRNPPFNVGQPMAGMQSRRTFRASELGIPVQCDIHDWMAASIAVFDHSFFAITGSDGSFSIEGLPPGEYEVEAWHPTLGSRTQRVTVTEGGAQLNLTFEAS